MVKNNVLIYVSIIFCILVYSKILPVQTEFINNSFINSVDITSIYGKVVSNPTKLSDKYYSVTVKPQFVKNNKCLTSSSYGKIKLLISSSVIEAFYPDKLYSKNKNIYNKVLPIEEGIYINCDVTNFIDKNSLETVFVCKEINRTFYKNSIIDKFYRFRANLRIQFKRLMSYWGNAGGLVLALISGSKEYLDNNINNSFRLTGVSHILALSGMHLALMNNLSGIIKNKTKYKKIAIIIQLLIILLFVFFAGFSPSLLRALICFSLISICTFLDITKINNINLLVSTFLIHLIIKKEDLFNISFMYSYLALLGIFLFSPIVNRFLTKFLIPYISNNLSSSISANVFTSVVSIKFFNTYSFGGIFCTLFVSPVITIFIYLSLIFILINLIFPFTCVYAKFVINLIYNLICYIVNIFKIIPVIKF